MPFSWPNPPGDPYPGVVQALKALKAAGFTIYIFTARAWRGWRIEDPKFDKEQFMEMYNWLKKWDVPYDAITNEKQPALFTIDDRTIGAGPWTDWAVVTRFLLAEAENGQYGKIGRKPHDRSGGSPDEGDDTP
jgi:hypothetical protein